MKLMENNTQIVNILNKYLETFLKRIIIIAFLILCLFLNTCYCVIYAAKGEQQGMKVPSTEQKKGLFYNLVSYFFLLQQQQ